MGLGVNADCLFWHASLTQSANLTLGLFLIFYTLPNIITPRATQPSISSSFFAPLLGYPRRDNPAERSGSKARGTLRALLKPVVSIYLRCLESGHMPT